MGTRETSPQTPKHPGTCKGVRMSPAGAAAIKKGNRKANTDTDRHTDTETDTDRHRDRQTDTHTHTNTHRGRRKQGQIVRCSNQALAWRRKADTDTSPRIALTPSCVLLIKRPARLARPRATSLVTGRCRVCSGGGLGGSRGSGVGWGNMNRFEQLRI